MTSPATVLLLGAAAVVGLTLYLKPRKRKKITVKEKEAPRTVEWTSGKCGTADQINVWIESHPERLSGAVNTKDDLPSAQQLETELGPLTGGGLAVVVEDECFVYVWTGSSFALSLEDTNELRSILGISKA